jgi:hypothetical protein
VRLEGRGPVLGEARLSFVAAVVGAPTARKTTVYERMASQRQRSWFATPVDFLQLSLETTLSLIVRLDEFWENAMLVVYERVHLRKEAHLAIKIRGHIAIKVTAI